MSVRARWNAQGVVTVTLIVSNTGQQAAADSTAIELPFANATVVSSVASAGTCTNGTQGSNARVSCALGPIGAGENRTVQVVLQVPPSLRRFLNYATVTTSSPDPNLWNNTRIVVIARRSFITATGEEIMLEDDEALIEEPRRVTLPVTRR
jgi:hypothetical protein